MRVTRQKCGLPAELRVPEAMRVPEVMRVKTRKNPKPAPLLPATTRYPTLVPETHHYCLLSHYRLETKGNVHINLESQILYSLYL